MSDDLQAKIAQIEAIRASIGDTAADAAIASLQARNSIQQSVEAADSDVANVRQTINYGTYNESSSLAELSGGFEALLAKARAGGATISISGENITIGNVAGGDFSQTNNDFRELADQIKQILSLIAQREAAAPEADLVELETLYRTRISEMHRFLTFQGVMQTVRAISLPLADVYVALQANSDQAERNDPAAERLLAKRDQASAAERVQLDQELELLQRNRASRAPQRVELAAAIREHQTLVVLGDPGSGKSTLLRYLALAFAQHAAPERLNLPENRLPILVPLAAYEAA